MSTPPGTFTQAWRAAGALRVRHRGQFELWHHGQAMRDDGGLRYTCLACGIVIERADIAMSANPAPHADPDSLWIVTQRHAGQPT